MLHQAHAKLFESTCKEPKAEKNVTMNVLSLNQDLRTHISPEDKVQICKPMDWHVQKRFESLGLKQNKPFAFIDVAWIVFKTQMAYIPRAKQGCATTVLKNNQISSFD